MGDEGVEVGLAQPCDRNRTHPPTAPADLRSHARLRPVESGVGTFRLTRFVTGGTGTVEHTSSTGNGLCGVDRRGSVSSRAHRNGRRGWRGGRSHRRGFCRCRLGCGSGRDDGRRCRGLCRRCLRGALGGRCHVWKGRPRAARRRSLRRRCGRGRGVGRRRSTTHHEDHEGNRQKNGTNDAHGARTLTPFEKKHDTPPHRFVPWACLPQR